MTRQFGKSISLKLKLVVQKRQKLKVKRQQMQRHLHSQLIKELLESGVRVSFTLTVFGGLRCDSLLQTKT